MKSFVFLPLSQGGDPRADGSRIQGKETRYLCTFLWLSNPAGAEGKIGFMRSRHAGCVPYFTVLRHEWATFVEKSNDAKQEEMLRNIQRVIWSS